MTVRSRGIVLALAALGGGLSLTGCGTTNVAAIVDGSVITQDEVEAAADQLNEQFDPPQPITPKQVLGALIIAPTVISSAEKYGHPQAADAAATSLTKVSDPAASTVAIIQENTALQAAQQAEQQELVAAVTKLKVTVNPQYGAFDPNTATVTDITPSWITSAEPAAQQ